MASLIVLSLRVVASLPPVKRVTSSAARTAKVSSTATIARNARHVSNVPTTIFARRNVPCVVFVKTRETAPSALASFVFSVFEMTYDSATNVVLFFATSLHARAWWNGVEQRLFVI